MNNPKHELKHKMKTARLNFNRAVDGHIKEQAIRQTIQYVLAEGGDPIEAWSAGIKMCTEANGNIKILSTDDKAKAVAVRWGDKILEEI